MNYLFIVPRDKLFGMLTIPPGVVYVATSLKNAGYQVNGLHLNFEDGDEQAIEEAIAKYDVEAVCIGGLSSQYTPIKFLISIIKNINRDIVTIIGGGLVTTEPELVLENIGADIGVIGQGEITITELAHALAAGNDLRGVDGLVFRENGLVVRNRNREEMKDLDVLGFPDYGIFDYPEIPNQPIRIAGQLYQNLNITASRSCPYNCTFCYHPSGSKYVRRSMDSIFAEIDFMLERYDIEYLSIIDELFAASRSRLAEFCERMESYDLKFAVQLRVDSVDEAMLVALRAAGCVAISYGLESADNEILLSMRKKTTIEQIETALHFTRQAGIFIQGFFIFGDVAETKTSVQKTLNWWFRHLEYGINLAVIDIFPGSFLYQHAVQKGIISDRLAFLEQGCPRINVSRLTDEEMKDLLEKIVYLSEEFVGVTAGIKVQRLNDDGSCDLVAECIHCGHNNQFTGVQFQYKNNQGVAAASCTKCRGKLKAPPSNAISRSTYKAVLDKVLEDFFAPLAGAGKRIVIWGDTEKSRCLLLGSASLRSCVVAVVDRDFQIKKGNLLGQYPVQSPVVLRELEFDYLIIGAAGYEEEIMVEARGMQPGIELLEI